MKLSIYITLLALVSTSVAQAGWLDRRFQDIKEFGQDVGDSVEKGWDNVSNTLDKAADGVSQTADDVGQSLSEENISQSYNNNCIGQFREGALTNLNEAEQVIGGTRTNADFVFRRNVRHTRIKALRGMCDMTERAEIEACVQKYRVLYNEILEGLSVNQINVNYEQISQKRREISDVDMQCSEQVFKRAGSHR